MVGLPARQSIDRANLEGAQTDATTAGPSYCTPAARERVERMRHALNSRSPFTADDP